MQIFATHKDPIQAVNFLDDKRVIKMILESAQLLSTAIIIRMTEKFGSYEVPSWMYKPTHVNHPCSIWTRESSSNWNWLYLYAITCCGRYERIFNRIHKSKKVIERLFEIYLQHKPIPEGKLTKFVEAYPEDFKVFSDTTLNYQNYLLDKWIRVDKRKPTFRGKQDNYLKIIYDAVYGIESVGQL